MIMKTTVNRRNFLRTAMLERPWWVPALPCLAAVTKPDECHFTVLKWGSPLIRCANTTLMRQSRRRGKQASNIFRSKKFTFPSKSTPQEAKEAARKIAAAGLVLMGGGVIYMKNDADQIRNVFRICKGSRDEDDRLQSRAEALDESGKARQGI